MKNFAEYINKLEAENKILKQTPLIKVLFL